MSRGVNSSYTDTHSLRDSLVVLPQSIGDDENSIISWYNNNDDNDNVDYNTIMSDNNEDFIDIDMVPDLHETLSSTYYTTIIDPVYVSLCLCNFREMLLSHRTLFRASSRNILNRKLNEIERTYQHKCKVDYVQYVSNSQNVCCYNVGIVAILEIFQRVDCNVDEYLLTINDCRCSRTDGKYYKSQIRCALETAGDNCHQCSMDYIISNLNTKFLKNIARAEFFTITDILDSNVTADVTELGATSSCFNSKPNGNNKPETGWLRRWLKRYRDEEAVIAIVYNEMVNTHDHLVQRNKVRFRIVDYFTFEAFHLTIPMELVKDEELERRLLQEEKVDVLKSEMLSYEHNADEFQTLLNHENERVHDMNVLGQIVGMFREQTIENFRDVSRPRGIHRIKVPNMHRHGVFIVQPQTVDLSVHASRDVW